MAYNSSAYQKAIHILERRRENATLDANIRKAEILSKLPEIDEIQSKLSAIGISISKCFFNKENNEAEIKKLESASLALQKKREDILLANGYGSDALSEQYICPICKDTGYFNNRMCSCHKEILKENERNNLRNIAPLDDCTFETFDVRYYPEEAMESGISQRAKAEKVLENCRIYAQKFNEHSSNLIFMGKTGLGKTHLSLAIANVAINKGFSVVYGSSQNILSDLQNENFGRTENNLYNEYDVLNADLLVIDDLGTEFKNAYSVACLYNIVNTRILKKKPTIISTNYDYNQLNELYDVRITSRIAGEYSTLVLEGKDIRYIK
ncbi:MAG: ATP-binding protein [Eubacterium sp.]|nr:ATP-binding protein [Eubacterium sp.]